MDLVKEQVALLAPNGRPSRLPADLWEYVRSDAFKSWFGDWERDPEHSSRILDENGEPLLVWHGSGRSFDAFDLSRSGENTGGGEWTDGRTGEKVADDSTVGVFLSSLKAQAVSYSLLAQFNAMNGRYRQVQGLIPIFNGPVNYDFKSREECLDAMRLVAESVPGVKAALETAEAEPGRKIVSDIVQSMPETERLAAVESLKRLRESYGKSLSAMRNGGLSNQYHNNVTQILAVESLKRDMDRLRRNDRTVRNTYGTFEHYNASIFGAGNATVDLYVEGGWSRDDKPKRILFSGEGRRFALDGASDRDIEWMTGVLDRYVDDAVRSFNEEVAGLGYEKDANLYGCFLNVRNPLMHDYEGSPFPDRYKQTDHPTGYVAARQVRKAIAEGRDGVIYKNIVDPFRSDTYGVFRTEDIMVVARERSMRIDRAAVIDGRSEQPSRDAEILVAGRNTETNQNTYSKMEDKKEKDILTDPGQHPAFTAADADWWFQRLSPRRGVAWALEQGVKAGAGDGVKDLLASVNAVSGSRERRVAAAGFRSLPDKDKVLVMEAAVAASEAINREAFKGRHVVLMETDASGMTSWKAVRSEEAESYKLRNLAPGEVAGSRLFCETYAAVMNRTAGTTSSYNVDGRPMSQTGWEYVDQALTYLSRNGARVQDTKVHAEGFAYGAHLNLSFFTDESVPFLEEAVNAALSGKEVAMGEGGQRSVPDPSLMFRFGLTGRGAVDFHHMLNTAMERYRKPEGKVIAFHPYSRPIPKAEFEKAGVTAVVVYPNGLPHTESFDMSGMVNAFPLSCWKTDGKAGLRDWEEKDAKEFRPLIAREFMDVKRGLLAMSGAVDGIYFPVIPAVPFGDVAPDRAPSIVRAFEARMDDLLNFSGKLNEVISKASGMEYPELPASFRRHGDGYEADLRCVIENFLNGQEIVWADDDGSLYGFETFYRALHEDIRRVAAELSAKDIGIWPVRDESVPECKSVDLQSFIRQQSPGRDGLLDQLQTVGRYDGCLMTGRTEYSMVAIDPKDSEKVLLVDCGKVLSHLNGMLDGDPGAGRLHVELDGKEYVFTTKETGEMAFGKTVEKAPVSGEGYMTFAYDVVSGKIAPVISYEKKVKTELKENERTKIGNHEGENIDANRKNGHKR